MSDEAKQFTISAFTKGGLQRLIKQYEEMGFKVVKKPFEDGALWKVVFE